MHSKQTGFDESHLIDQLKHYLPSQTPIRDFIHHNTLHALQHMKFYEAIFNASTIFGYQVTLELADYRQLLSMGRIQREILEDIVRKKKGDDHLREWLNKMINVEYDCRNRFRIGRIRAYWKELYHIDIDNMVHPLLFRILGSYLDQGISLWHFPRVEQGFLNAVRALEAESFSSFFKTKRARNLLLSGDYTMRSLLDILVGAEELYEEYIFDQQFSHHGWSGMVATVEAIPDTLLYNKSICLQDLIVFELLLEIDNIDAVLGQRWSPIATKTKIPVADLFEKIEFTELQEVFMLWQDAFEWSYYDKVLSAIHQAKQLPQAPQQQKTFQAIFCIDERECSLRRYLEAVDPDAETLGTPGFFGVEFYFLPEGGKFYEKLCPVSVTPNHLIKESEAGGERHFEILYAKKSHTFFTGFLYSLFGGFWAGLKLILNTLKPGMSPALSNTFSHMGKESVLQIEKDDTSDVENGLQVGFTVDEMAERVESVLKSIGMVDDFAPLVYLLSHGSSTANNPHHGAYDCGACSGRPGAVNARVFAYMANHIKVREILRSRGISIPPHTAFIGALHDTSGDHVTFYDEDVLQQENKVLHLRNREKFELALDLNAKERSRRFASIDTREHIRKVRKAVRERSLSFFEPRPELGHGTNALCFVGRRELTKELFLDRRAFMNSYDHRIDPDGKLLLEVLKPLPPVCGGINLEYYFSRVDNQKFGAGTKLSHNVMGLIGVSNSSDGDLRPGLPRQMVEVHDPIRLMMIVEHYPEVVLKTIQSADNLFEWFENEWVHLVCIHPDSNQFFLFSDNHFTPYLPLNENIPVTDNVQGLIEQAFEMEINHILHATKENLPVHLIKK